MRKLYVIFLFSISFLTGNAYAHNHDYISFMVSVDDYNGFVVLNGIRMPEISYNQGVSYSTILERTCPSGLCDGQVYARDLTSGRETKIASFQYNKYACVKNFIAFETPLVRLGYDNDWYIHIFRS